jgi:hypothetical protein
VFWVNTNVSEDRAAYIFNVEVHFFLYFIQMMTLHSDCDSRVLLNFLLRILNSLGSASIKRVLTNRGCQLQRFRLESGIEREAFVC